MTNAAEHDRTHVSGDPAPFDSAWLRVFRRKLVAWFARNARSLPWRADRDPYRVWLSEIMLQQTQVETVKPYFERFLTAFPTLRSLAEADEQQVLRLWEGLGYYRRARQLHRAAKIVADEHDGRFPNDPEAVLRLPGIGRYTANAILSIAFDQRRAILEANTIRLLSRLSGYLGDPASTSGRNSLWRIAEALLPERRTGQFNQALMELGSLVCQPRQPRCEICPAATVCRAKAEGLQLEIPRPKVQPVFEDVREASALVRRRGQVLLIQWPEGRRWAGLWDFPRFPIRGENAEAIHGEIVENVRRMTGAEVRPGNHLKTLRHGVTRFRITLDCYEAAFLSQGRSAREIGVMKWVLPTELNDYPLSTTGRKISKLV